MITRELSSFITQVTPGQMRVLEMQHDDMLSNAAKIQGLFNFLNFCDTAAFERCLGRSGKSPMCLSRAPDGGPTPRKFATITSVGTNRKGRQQEAARAAFIGQQRKTPASLMPEEVMARLHDVFLAYCDPLLRAQAGRREMSIVGFCRLLRDCRLLDNRLTLVAADVVFTRVEAGAEVGSGGQHTELGDMHVDFEEFKRCLRSVARMKLSAPGSGARSRSRSPSPSPGASPVPAATLGAAAGAGADGSSNNSNSSSDEGLLVLARKWLLPFARDGGGGGAGGGSGGPGGSSLGLHGGGGGVVDGLFSRGTMNLLRRYDAQLKQLFAWYASLEETDPLRVSWPWVRDHGCGVSASAFCLLLLNFSVLPTLLAKGAALEVYAKAEAANDGDERSNVMLFPAFLEAMAEVALAVGAGALPRLRATTSPDELKLLRRYAAACPPPHGSRLLEAYQEVLAARGRDATSLDQRAAYDAEGVRRQNNERAAAAAQQHEVQQTMGVVSRRENTRQRFALTRLRNYYRDVRTVTNNTTWPPERDLSPGGTRRSGQAGPHGHHPWGAGHAAGAGSYHHHGAGGGGSSGDDEEGVHVAFYDAERAIKTPRPVWVPVGHHPPRRLSLNTGYGAAEPPPSPGPGLATQLGGGANLLLVDPPAPTPSAMGPAAAARMPGAVALGPGLGGPLSPGAFGRNGAAAAFARTPKASKYHYQLAVAIEDRDEHEAILDLAGRLPLIRAAPASEMAGAASLRQRQEQGLLGPEVSAAALAAQGRPRAVTAPAELRSSRSERGGDGAGEVEGGAWQELGLQGGGADVGGRWRDEGLAGGAGEGGREGADAAPRRLPPVTHQPHRSQATAAAMAAMAGQPPAPPQHAVARGNSLAGPHHPPSLGPLLAGIPLGPSPSQLAALGVLPACALTSSNQHGSMGSPSPTFSPHSSLTRSPNKRGGGCARKRSDLGLLNSGLGLPNMGAPGGGEGGPSRDVAAALQELDRFDGALGPPGVRVVV